MSIPVTINIIKEIILLIVSKRVSLYVTEIVDGLERVMMGLPNESNLLGIILSPFILISQNGK